MEVSKKALIVTLIINLLLLAIGTVCIIVLDYSILSLSLFLAACVFVAVSSVFVWKLGQDYKKD